MSRKYDTEATDYVKAVVDDHCPAYTRNEILVLMAERGYTGTRSAGRSAISRMKDRGELWRVGWRKVETRFKDGRSAKKKIQLLHVNQMYRATKAELATVLLSEEAVAEKATRQKVEEFAAAHGEPFTSLDAFLKINKKYPGTKKTNVAPMCTYLMGKGVLQNAGKGEVSNAGLRWQLYAHKDVELPQIKETQQPHEQLGLPTEDEVHKDIEDLLGLNDKTPDVKELLDEQKKEDVEMQTLRDIAEAKTTQYALDAGAGLIHEHYLLLERIKEHAHHIRVAILQMDERDKKIVSLEEVQNQHVRVIMNKATEIEKLEAKFKKSKAAAEKIIEAKGKQIMALNDENNRLKAENKKLRTVGTLGLKPEALAVTAKITGLDGNQKERRSSLL